MSLVEIGHNLWMLQGAGDRYVHPDKFSTLFLLMRSHTATKLTRSQVYPDVMGKGTKPCYLRKVTVSRGVTLWTPQVSSELTFEGLPFPCVPSRKVVAIWSKVFVKFIAAINVIHRNINRLLLYCTTGYSHQCAKALEFINASKIKMDIFQQKLPWQNTGCDDVWDTSDLL